jgi:putative ABC transport system permease protein
LRRRSESSGARLARFVLDQLRASRGRALVLGVGLLMAGVGFGVLNSVSVSSAVAVQGTLDRNFQPAYDILVRPRGTVTPLERLDRLVNGGFLSDLYGGISLRQWRAILRLRGVAVAAPVENVGYTLVPLDVSVNLRRVIGPGSQQLFRIVPSWVVHGGLARYPDVDQYLYYSTDRWVQAPGQGAPSLLLPGRAKPLAACPNFLYAAASPSGGQTSSSQVFAYKADEGMDCAGPNQDVRGTRYSIEPPGNYTVQVGFGVPVLVTAIDPVQEARLVGLSGAMVRGSYLREGEGLSAPVLAKFGRQFKNAYRTMPLIASSRSFVDEALRIEVQRLAPSAPAQVPEQTASRHVGEYLDGLPGRSVLDQTFSSRALYRTALSEFGGDNPQAVGDYWTTGPVRYRVVGRQRLAALTVSNPPSVWEPIGQAMQGGSSAAPGADATQFRRLTAYDLSGTITTLANGDGLQAGPRGELRGTFDPARLRGFAPLSRVPLGTFFAPVVSGATKATRAVLHDRPLGPTTNIAGYLGQPPLVLTTLKAAAAFFDSAEYTGNQPRGAPIAAIQVRVAGLHGASRASIARVKRVANEIYQATHLQVDITAGSSPTPVRIDLPAGGFGQPPLAVVQGWVKKGVATIVLDASNAKDSALFLLILLVAGLFVANASFAAVRQRRGEIATLATLGWERGQIFTAVLGEVGAIGLLAGVLGAGIAAIVIAVAGLRFSLGRVVGVIPASVAVAVVAGAVPALAAARLEPLAGLAAPVRAGAAHRRVRSVLGLGWVNLTRLPWRSALGGLGLVIGVGSLAFLLGIQHAFSGAVAGDVLGNHIDVEVRGADYVAVALIFVLSIGSVADVLIMNLRERSGELAALAACGWSERSLRRLVLSEGLTIGVIGALIGAALGLAGAALLGADPASVAPATAAAFAAGVAVCAAAALPALSVLARQTPAALLASE